MQSRFRTASCLTTMVFVGVLSLFAACGGGSSSGSSSSDTVDPTTDPTATGEASKSMQLTMTAGSADSVSDLIRDTVTPLSYCNPAGLSETQKCHSTPQNYDLGILAVYLVDCHDSTGNSVTCASPDYDNVASRLELYNGDQRDLTIDSTGTGFDQELTALASDGTYGAIQIVTAYIQQKFPDDTSDATEAAKVVDGLKGVTYRICTSLESEIDGTTMATRCGREDAQMGDYLIDMDSDGTFGFMVVSNDGTTTSITETDTRPASYTYNDPAFAAQQVSFLQDGEEYTSASFYGVAGYFAPMLSFSSTQSMDSDLDYNVAVSFTITDSFEWHDGAESGIPDASICVSAISDQTCSPDDDADTVGVYDPFFDSAFLPNVPQVDVGLDELHERLYIATGEYSIRDEWDGVLRFEAAEDINSDADGTTVTPDATLPVKQMVSSDGIYQNFAHGVYLSNQRDTLFLSMLFTDSDYNGIDTECSLYTPTTTPPECDTANRDGSLAIIDGISTTASGAVTLNRHIEGSNTQLDQPHGVWVDEQNELIYVANTFGGSILVFNDAFDTATDGNIAPDRVITSSVMERPVFVFIDEEDDRMFVANMGSAPSILIFNNASTLNGSVTPETRIVDDTPSNRSDTDTTRLTMGNNQTTHNVFYDHVHQQILVGHHTNEVIFYDVSGWDLDTGVGDIEPDASDVKYLQINENSTDESSWSAYGIFYLPSKDRLFVSCGYTATGPSRLGSPPHEIKVYDNVSDAGFSGMETPSRTVHWSNATTYFPPQGLWVTEYH